MNTDNALTDPIEIKIDLIRANILQSQIARKLGVSKVIITNVIKGRRTSRRVKKAIAKAIGRRVEELWPADAEAMAGRPSCVETSAGRPEQNHKRKAA